MRIGLVGPFNAGKTELAKSLYQYIKSYGYIVDVDTPKKFVEKKRYNLKTIKNILTNENYQYDLYKELYRKHSSTENLLTDAPLINCIGYCSLQYLNNWIEIVSLSLYDVLVYCEPYSKKNENFIIKKYREKVNYKIIQALIKMKKIKKSNIVIKKIKKGEKLWRTIKGLTIIYPLVKNKSQLNGKYLRK